LLPLCTKVAEEQETGKWGKRQNELILLFLQLTTNQLQITNDTPKLEPIGLWVASKCCLFACNF
jgi:hypothetical protein